jgi:hypothetical protein
LVQLNFGNHRVATLQKDWNEYGEDNFAFEIISQIEEEEDKNVDYPKEVKTLEKMFIEELQPFYK